MTRIHVPIKFIFIVVFLMVSVLAGTFLIHAQTAEELQGKINEKNGEIASLEAEIAQYQSELTTIGANKATLNSTIQKLQLERKKLLTDIQITESKIESANLTLDELSLHIQTNATVISNDTQAVKASIKKMNDFDKRSLIEVFLSNENISDGWREVENLIIFQDTMRAQIKTLAQAKTDLENHKTKVESVKSDLVDLNAERSDQKKIVDQNASEKAKLLAETKNKESEYSKLLAQKIASKTQFEQDLHSYESQLKFILDPSSIPAAGSSPLNWPLTTVRITQLFGKTVSAKRLYVTGSHNGVDFGASIGTPAMAMANGKVIGSGNTDLSCPGASYGNWILIAYDNGLTSVYGHLSLVKAAVGDRVASGQIVAYTGSTGYSTGPHLHVSLWPSNGVEIAQVPSHACTGHTYTQPVAAANAYLDPMLYMPKYTGPLPS